jgi:hypothetical protein
MRRKTQPKPETLVPPEVLEQAKPTVPGERLDKVAKCMVCGADTTLVAAGEPLCWVCRRLKISAWREIEQQMPAQE